jgi:hypothetical protein
MMFPCEFANASTVRFANERAINPVARIFKAAANVSPSPWGEGRDEGGRPSNFSLPLKISHIYRPMCRQSLPSVFKR